MQKIAWTADAIYNGRRATLEECVRAWKRDAQRGCGALGVISTARVVRMNGEPLPSVDLTIAECLMLADELRTAHRARSETARPGQAAQKAAATAIA